MMSIKTIIIASSLITKESIFNILNIAHKDDGHTTIYFETHLH